MDVPIGERWQSFVTAAIETGRYVSASDVVTEGLRLVQEREERLQALRASIDAAIEENIWHTPEQVELAVKTRLDAIFGEAEKA